MWVPLLKTGSRSRYCWCLHTYVWLPRHTLSILEFTLHFLISHYEQSVLRGFGRIVTRLSHEHANPNLSNECQNIEHALQNITIHNVLKKELHYSQVINISPRFPKSVHYYDLVVIPIQIQHRAITDILFIQPRIDLEINLLLLVKSEFSFLLLQIR